MTDSGSESGPRAAVEKASQQGVVDKLVFAALREQTRARRWRVGFMLFFVVYLSVVTVILFTGGDDGFGAAGKPDGDRHTAVVKLSGVIASGEPGGSENVIAGLRSAFEHDDTAAVVLEINSPGGSPVQASDIFDEIQRLRKKHGELPVYAVVSDIAASGGYFVAAAADRIYVNKSSLVGSIGVRLDAFGFVGLMEKLGIERRLLTAGENKAMFDPFLPENDEQKAHLQTVLNQVHAHFIDAVTRGRGERLADDADLFSGLVWSGEQAIDLGLADAYGSTRSVARELGAEDVVDFSRKSSLIDRIAERIGASLGRQVASSFAGKLSVN